MNQSTQSVKWKSVAKIPGFAFRSFAELQTAVAKRKANLGVDALAAAEWADARLTGYRKALITGLSLLLLAAALAAIVAAFWTRNYWLLVAVPVQAATFYVSHPASPLRQWATLGGLASVILFGDFVLNRQATAATIVAYAALTFAAVRASGYVTNSAFRKSLLADEELFLHAYANHLCTVRDNETERVYEHAERGSKE